MLEQVHENQAEKAGPLKVSSKPLLHKIDEAGSSPLPPGPRVSPGPDQSATAFAGELRRLLPPASQRLQTGHASEFCTDCTWHLHELGIAHRSIPLPRHLGIPPPS